MAKQKGEWRWMKEESLTLGGLAYWPIFGGLGWATKPEAVAHVEDHGHEPGKEVWHLIFDCGSADFDVEVKRRVRVSFGGVETSEPEPEPEPELLMAEEAAA